jgi:hypothetical protein
MLEESVVSLWDDYKAYAVPFSTDANLLHSYPKGVISFPLVSLAIANENASGAADDDGLIVLSHEYMTNAIYTFLSLHDILSFDPDGYWDADQLTPDNIPDDLRVPRSVGVEKFQLKEEDLKGRNGLRVGDSALRATGDLGRGQIIGVYSGTYDVAGQGPVVDPKTAERQFSVTFAGKHQLLITPVDSTHLMQYANDVSVDLADKFGGASWRCKFGGASANVQLLL